MASINTYAKLIKPPQFAANEESVFRLEYSRDLSCEYATLKIYDYFLGYHDKSYSNYTQTHYINTSMAGTGIEEFIVPANSLGQIATEQDITVGTRGQMKAVIEIGSELDGEGNAIPLYRSNEIIVDMVYYWENDFYLCGYANGEFIDNVINATSSNVYTYINYLPRNSVSSYGSADVNSYSILLYDSNYNLIYESDEMYNWESQIERRKKVLLSDLDDNTRYYVRAKVTLVGGYTRYSLFATLTVKYAEIPPLNSEIELSNDIINGCVKVTLTENIDHDKIVISRAIINSDDYLEIKSINGNFYNVTFKDYYTLPNITYIYKVILYKNNDIVNTYYNIITHKMSGLCIADIQGSFSTEIFESIDIDKNDRAGILEPMDNDKPFSIINSSLDYDSSGGITATFAEKDECQYNFNPDGNDNTAISEKARHWLNNGNSKLLKIGNGECWIVTTNGVKTNYSNNGLAQTTFGWTEIADAHLNESYLREGLIRIE